MLFSGLFGGACRISNSMATRGKGHGASTNAAAFGKGKCGPHRRVRERGTSLKKRFPFPAIRSALVDPVMAPEAAGVAQGTLGDAVGRLAAVEKIDPRPRQGRFPQYREAHGSQRLQQRQVPAAVPALRPDGTLGFCGELRFRAVPWCGNAPRPAELFWVTRG